MDDEDKKLFRSSIGDVHKIKQDRVLSTPRKPKPIPYQTLRDEQHVIEDMIEGEIDPSQLETGDELLFQKEGVQHKVLKKLRRGQFKIEASLDLHGLFVTEAKQTLSKFLGACHAKNHRCIKVIHGKGHGSKDGKPVIKNKVNIWLRQRDDILAYCSALANDGGTGAIYVLLRKASQTAQ